MSYNNRILAVAAASLFILSSLCYTSCSPSKINTTHMLPAFDKEGHRGCRGLMPENTIPAMIYALTLGVTTLEMDISFSKDKKALLSHEPFFNHEITTKPGGGFIEEKEEKLYNMYRMNYDSIVKYDVGLKAHPRFPEQKKMRAVKPLLSNLFEIVIAYMEHEKGKRPFPFFNIETKSLPATDNLYHPEPAEFIELLMGVIRQYKMEAYVIIQSFDPRTLQYLHQKYPSIKTSFLSEADSKSSFRKQMRDLGFTPTVYSPEFSLVNEALVKDCHDQNIKIIPWTVNDKKKIDELKLLGVDGIISDYPNLFNE